MKLHIRRAICAITVLTLLFALIPVASAYGVNNAIWDGSIADCFSDGNGSESEPYVISSASELAYLAQSVNDGNAYEGVYFRLSDNICLNDTGDWMEWQNDVTPANIWTAIGTNDAPFCGFFDGCGYTISGMYINDTASPDTVRPQGLFGCFRAGAFAAAAIENVCIAESYVNGNSMIGAIVGSVDDGAIRNCNNSGTVSGTNNVGGIVGHINGECELEITECTNSGVIIGRNNFIGGIVGGTYCSTVALCSNTGTVTGNDYVAGIVGGNDWNGTVEKSFNAGDIIGNTSVGGVVGYNNGWVFDCYNSASVSADNEVGGVTGSNLESKVSRCYNVGNVICPDGYDYGGVIGVDYDSCDFSSGYYLDDCCEQDNGYGMALTVDQLMDAASYEGFNFESTWFLDVNSEYPYAQLIDNPHTPTGDVPPTIPGDADGNGMIEIADAILILRHSLGVINMSDELLPICDVDGDGIITTTDALIVMRSAMNV